MRILYKIRVAHNSQNKNNVFTIKLNYTLYLQFTMFKGY